MSNVSSSPDSGLIRYYQGLIQNLKDEQSRQNKQANENKNRELDSIRENNQKELQRKETALAEAIETTRKDANEISRNEKDSHQYQLNQLREQLYNAKGQLGESVPLDEHRKDIQKFQDQAQRRHDLDLKNFEDREDDFRHQIHEVKRESNDEIKRLTANQKEEIHQYDKNTKDFIDFNKKDAQLKAEAMVDSKREFENQRRSEIRRLDEANHENIDHLQRSLQDKDYYYMDLIEKTSKEKENQFTNFIKRQNSENYNNTKMIEDQFHNQIDRLETQRKQGENRSNERLENAMSQASEREKMSLDKQSQAQHEAIHQLRKTNEEQIDHLKRSLQKQRTTDDPANIPPGAEAVVRKSLIREYEKSLQTEIDKNKLKADELQQKYAEMYKKATEEFSDKATTTAQQNALMSASDRSQFLDTIQETEFQTNNKLKEQDLFHEQNRENLIKKFTHLMASQKRDYDQMMEAQRNNAEARVASMKRDSDTLIRQKEREYAFRQNEYIHNYEKKMTDLKTDLTNEMDDLKSQHMVELRELDRKSKQQLDEQAKQYEIRIAQMEAQQKERERTLNQNYQDELDKARRSYEIYKQKKS